jgi:membrane protein
LGWLFDPARDLHPGWKARAVDAVRCVVLAYREFRLNFCWERAASLAFATVISLLPLAVLFLSLLAVFFKEEEIQRFFREKILEYFATENLRPEVERWIQNLSQGLFDLGVGTNFLAILGLIAAALALLLTSERVFCRIWKVKSNRSYLQKFIAFWVILTTSPLLVGVSFYVDSLSRTSDSTIHRWMQAHAFLKTIYGLLLPLVVSCSAFTLLYIMLPNTRVRLRPAIVGGCIAGLLWEALKGGFFLYYERAKELENFYGKLGTVPIFLFFVYLSWLIILAGGELSYAAQNRSALVREYRQRDQAQAGRGISPAFLGLFYLEQLLSAYYSGARAPTAESVARALDAAAEDLDPVLSSLVQQGVIVECGSESGTYVPARDPASCPLRPILAALLSLQSREDDLLMDAAPSASLPGVGRVAAAAAGSRSAGLHTRARSAFLDVFDPLTLADLGAAASALNDRKADA